MFEQAAGAEMDARPFGGRRVARGWGSLEKEYVQPRACAAGVDQNGPSPAAAIDLHSRMHIAVSALLHRVCCIAVRIAKKLGSQLHAHMA